MTSTSRTTDAAIVTLWFVSTSDVRAAVTSGTRADRGFGRKYLAQLNSGWPITPIGSFRLAQSVPASTDEFYIAGFPGVTMVQTSVAKFTSFDALSRSLVTSLPADHVYGFATGSASVDTHEADDNLVGAFAHWSGDDWQLQRSFAATRGRILADIGVPEPFEQPFWASQRPRQGSHHPLDLPFDPVELSEAAATEWLGFHPLDHDAPDLQVWAFATDGRPEPHLADRPRIPRDMEQLISTSAKKLNVGLPADFDDYEQHTDGARNEDVAAILAGIEQLAVDAKQRVTRAAKSAVRTTANVIRSRFGRG